MRPNPIFTDLLYEYYRAGRTPVGNWHYTVRPRGTVRMLSATSAGIEPLFQHSFRRVVLADGDELQFSGPTFTISAH